MRALLAFLENHWALCLGTISQHGPYTTPLWYALDYRPLQFIFISHPKTRHMGDISANPETAASIFNHAREPASIQGAQFSGRVRISEHFESAKGLYLRRFPQLVEFFSKFSEHRFAIFQPYWARFIDNTTHFGFSKEWTCSKKEGLW